MLTFLAGMATMFLLMVGIARLVRHLNRGQVSTVRTIHPDGSETVERETRQPRTPSEPDVADGAAGENSIQSVGENVHAVVRQGQA